MKLVRQDLAAAVADHGPIFVGDVLRQNLVAEGDADSLRVTAVTFRDGARNRWHHHSTEQVPVVTAGRGIVACDEEELRVSPGDVVLVRPGSATGTARSRARTSPTSRSCCLGS